MGSLEIPGCVSLLPSSGSLSPPLTGRYSHLNWGRYDAIDPTNALRNTEQRTKEKTSIASKACVCPKEGWPATET